MSHYQKISDTKFKSNQNLGIHYNNIHDYTNTAYVGWDRSAIEQPGYRMFFSNENIKFIQETVRNILLSAGYNIVVSEEVVTGVMSDVFQNRTPIIGDMYTYYTIPQNEPRNDVNNNTERVINTIANYIMDAEDMKKWNYSLNKWDTVYGDFNRKGLRSHSIIKKREKDYMKGQVNFNY